ncbi:MAG: type II toxin-antitoxin system prevent-host-death family antitoxin [Opitutaceae bacterium]|nr:type II toxin-antitoxin system prevent-host-death family antitoxin [Opitutaceae bacterium]
MSATKTVGAYEAKTTLPALLDFVARGREVVITKHERPVARLIPIQAPTPAKREVFARIRRLRARLSLPQGETARDLIEAGRRI